MDLIWVFIATALAGLVLITFFKGRSQRMLFFLFLLLLAVISAIPAWQALTGNSSGWMLQGNQVTGPIPVRMDALSGWFILIIDLVFLTGGLYGIFYLKSY